MPSPLSLAPLRALRRAAADPSLFVTVWFTLPVAAFLALQFYLRLACGPGIQWDDGELLVYSQAFAWGYSEQPPLYAWLCRLVFFATGPSVVGLTVVRTAVLGAGFVFAYLVAARLTADRRLAVLAGCAPLVVLNSSWAAIALLTHSNLMTAAALAAAWAVLRLADDPRPRNYALLGAAVAVGVLSKYNFVWFAGGLAVAAAAVPEYRRRLFAPRFLIAVGVAAALVAPHALWLAGHRAEVAELLRAKTLIGVKPGAGYGARVGKAAVELGLTVLGGILPAVAAVALAFGRATADRTPSSRLLGRFFALTLVLLVLMVLGLGVGRFHSRWAQPFCVLFAVWWVARVPAAAATPAAVRRCALGLAVVAAGFVAARAVEATGVASDTTRAYIIHTDLAPVAAEIRAVYGDRPTILVHEPELAGLKTHLPDARLVWTRSTLYGPPAGRPVVAVWNHAFGAAPPWPLYEPGGGIYAKYLPPRDPVRTVPAGSSVPRPSAVVLAFVRVRPR